jgi:hypothetical protein
VRQPMQILKRYQTHVALVLANVAFAAVFVTVALSGFHQPTPHDLPVGVVAPAPISQRIQGALDAHIPGGFHLRDYPSEARAHTAITKRQLDGAVIATPGGLRVLTAEAGGTAPTQAITTAFDAVAAKSGQQLTTVDVVPPLPGDSQGLSSFFLILCVLFPSLATGISAGHIVRQAHPVSRFAVPLVGATAIGLAATGIADGISGLGNYWALAGIVALFSLAISAPTAALGQIKPQLVALAILAFLVFGIPVSGGPANLAAFGPSFLRSLGSVLPLGAAANTIRNTVYFRANDTTGHLWVLAAYAAGGLAALGLLIAVPRRRGDAPPASEGGVVQPPSAAAPHVGPTAKTAASPVFVGARLTRATGSSTCVIERHEPDRRSSTERPATG